MTVFYGTCSISPLVVPEALESFTGADCVMVVSGSVVMTVSVVSVDSTVVVSFLHDVITRIEANDAAMTIRFIFFISI